MKIRTATLLATAVVTGGLLAGACSSSSSPSSSTSSTAATAATSSKTILQVAEANPEFSTLVAAVKAAGLVSTLDGKGPYTVFAPTNAAFAALPAGTLQSLLQPANKAELSAILTYHVVPGAVTANHLMDGPVKTVNGAAFTVNLASGTPTITDGRGDTAHIVKTDIMAANGVIHVIDAVLLPPAS